MTQIVRFRRLEKYGFGPNVMKKTKVCSNCGRMASARAKTCPSCGEKLSQETLFDRYKRQHITCPKCDTILSSDSLYCPNCGREIRKKA